MKAEVFKKVLDVLRRAIARGNPEEADFEELADIAAEAVQEEKSPSPFYVLNIAFKDGQSAQLEVTSIQYAREEAKALCEAENVSLVVVQLQEQPLEVWTLDKARAVEVPY